MLFDVNIESLKIIKNVLNFVAQAWRRPAGVMIKDEVIEKPNYYKNHFSLTEQKRELLETILDVTI